MEHVNNITFWRILEIATQMGWEDLVLGRMQGKLTDPRSIESSAKRFVAKAIRGFGPFPAKGVYWARNLVRQRSPMCFGRSEAPPRCVPPDAVPNNSR